MTEKNARVSANAGALNVLLLCDDYWHPGKIPAEGILPLEKKGFNFDIISDAGDFNPEMLPRYPAVLLCKSDEVSGTDKQSWKTGKVQQAFIDYVESGGGLLAVHSATVAGKNTEALDRLLGCRFTYHPNECPVTVQPIKPHPVTKNAGMFCETEEQYRIELLTDDADILIASYSPAQGTEAKYKEDPYNNTPAMICPAGYVRTQGKGRICVLTSGHHLNVWLNPQFQQLLENALKWCAALAAAKV